jgi:hypothetical protein
MGTRRVAVVSDMHVGSTVGLWDTFVNPEGEPIVGTEASKQLGEYWEDYWEFARDVGYDSVFLVGDLCQGSNRKDAGRYLISSNLDWQTSVAADMLKPHVGGKIVHSVSGSQYHQGMETVLDEGVSRLLEPHCKSVQHWGEMVNLEMEGTDKVIQLTHGAGAGTMYRESAMGRRILNIAIGVGNGKLERDIDMVIEAHLHAYHYVEDEQRTFMINPCWMLSFPWKPIIKSYGRSMPTIGATVLEIDNRGIRVYIPHRNNGHKFYPYFAYHDALREG